MAEYGTQVKNPVHRPGRRAFVPCCHCGKLYSALGISRHWGKCPGNPNRRK